MYKRQVQIDAKEADRVLLFSASARLAVSFGNERLSILCQLVRCRGRSARRSVSTLRRHVVHYSRAAILHVEQSVQVGQLDGLLRPRARLRIRFSAFQLKLHRGNSFPTFETRNEVRLLLLRNTTPLGRDGVQEKLVDRTARSGD